MTRWTMTRWNEPITDWSRVWTPIRTRIYTIQEIADEAKEERSDTRA